MNPEVSVLANSLPRGGPFLLTSALQLLGYQKFLGAEQYHSPAAFNYLEAKKALQGRQTSAAENMIGISPFSPCYLEKSLLQNSLNYLSQNEYIMAHIAYNPALSEAVMNANCRHIVILRDPRSLLLSLLFDTHVMPRFLIEPFTLLSVEQQLDFMLSGGKIPQTEMTLIGFVAMYQSMLQWLHTPHCLVVRFEDLAGSQGGGSQEQQYITLKNMAAFLNMSFDTSIEEKMDQIKDPSIPTFRLDQQKQWENTISPNIIERVLSVCETLVIEAGYCPL